MNSISPRADGASRALSAIDHLMLVVTAQCNLRCSYCYQNSKKPLKMQWDTLKAGICLALGEATPVTQLMFSGGEPLLEFELIRKAVEYAESSRPPGRRIRYWLSTNGTLLTNDVLDFLQEHDFDLQLSFDGIAPAQAHRDARAFEVLDRLLDALQTSHPRLFQHGLRIAVTVIPSAVCHVASSVDYLIRRGARDIIIAPSITPDPRWTIKDVGELDQQIARISDISRQYLAQTGDVPVRMLRKTRDKPLRGTNNSQRCNGLSGRAAVVDVDGHMYGCPLLVESVQDFSTSPLLARLQSLRVGDIREPGLHERRAAVLRAAQDLVPAGWARQLFSSFGPCRECRHFAECSFCPVSIWNNPDSPEPFRVPDFICAFKRTLLKYRERFPYMQDLFDDLKRTSDGRDPIEPLVEYLRAKRDKPV